MLTGEQVPALSAVPMLTAWVLPGRIDRVPEVRRWVGALTASADYAPADPQLAIAELFTNAVTHSRSGLAGGVVTVIVAAGPGWVDIHVHDQGADDSQVPHLRSQRPAALGESGRGLRLVAAISVLWAAGPVVWCRLAAADDPAVAAGGCCVWCHIRQAPSGTAASDSTCEADACQVPQPRPGGLLLIADGVRTAGAGGDGRPPRLLGGGEGTSRLQSVHETPAARK